jgi:hypothetical protein
MDFLSRIFAGKRYAYKFDFAGLAAATQPQATDASYKYQSDLFMSPYHGAKLSSFMSPHHSMASSSGECFMLFPISVAFPSANTLSCRQSIRISSFSARNPNRQINKNQIFKSISLSGRKKLEKCLAQAEKKNTSARSAPDNCTRSLCERFPFGVPFFDGRNFQGKSSRKYELPWLVPLSPSSAMVDDAPPFRHSIYFIMNDPFHSATPLFIHCYSPFFVD